MADEEIKQYPDFPRLVTRDSIEVDSGYELQAGPLIEALAEALKKIPVEHHHRAGIFYPDEYGDEWGINWWTYESDEAYEARYAAHVAAKKTRDDDLRAQYKDVQGVVEAAQTINEKRNAIARLERLERRAKELGCELHQ